MGIQRFPQYDIWYPANAIEIVSAAEEVLYRESVDQFLYKSNFLNNEEKINFCRRSHSLKRWFYIRNDRNKLSCEIIQEFFKLFLILIHSQFESVNFVSHIFPLFRIDSFGKIQVADVIKDSRS